MVSCTSHQEAHRKLVFTVVGKRMFVIFVSTFDPWTMEEVGLWPLLIWKSVRIFWLPKHVMTAVPQYPWMFCSRNPADTKHLRSSSLLHNTAQKNPHSWPSISLNSQLRIENTVFCLRFVASEHAKPKTQEYTGPTLYLLNKICI